VQRRPAAAEAAAAEAEAAACLERERAALIANEVKVIQGVTQTLGQL
jgi:hypothetical protein